MSVASESRSSELVEMIRQLDKVMKDVADDITNKNSTQFIRLTRLDDLKTMVDLRQEILQHAVKVSTEWEKLKHRVGRIVEANKIVEVRIDDHTDAHIVRE